ncbi:elongation factor P [Candidatus Microgenomates bacterium]|nr:MAG: elongation factor P [Candidatus Microgenomates bacterium]
MISVTELRNGTVFEDYGQLFQVLSYEHIKMGRGSATIKVKVKNVRSGSTTERSFVNGAKVNNIQLTKREYQFLYKDNDFTYFMEPSTFEQLNLPIEKFSDHIFLKEGQNFFISFLREEALSLEIPPKMDLKVTDTGPSLRGNSATNIYKDAILENGLKTKVPLFIEIGDKVRIDTRTGAYSEKA